MVRINWRTSLGTGGRPCLPRRTFQDQKRRKPCRCQPMTVEALMIKTLDCQSFQTALSQAHKNRSAGVSLGRLTERCRTPSGWRRARISSCSAARLRNEAKSAVKKADNRCPKENRRKNDNSQFINQIGVCENHRLLSSESHAPGLAEGYARATASPSTRSRADRRDPRGGQAPSSVRTSR